MTERKRWMGEPPTKCDTCDAPITTEFYDMKTTMGPWGFLCPTCALLGPGIGRVGTGFGQQYRQDEDGGKFYKVAG